MLMTQNLCPMNKLNIAFIVSALLLACQESKPPMEHTYALGNLLFSQLEIGIGNASLNKDSRDTISVYNPTEEDITLCVIKEHPEISMFRTENGREIPAENPFVLPGRQRTFLIMQLHPQDSAMYGSYSKALHFTENGDTLVVGIPIRGFVVDNFDGVSPDHCPRIEVDKDSLLFHFRQEEAPPFIPIAVTITNTGNADLIIRKVEPEGYGYHRTLPKYRIAPHEQVVLTDTLRRSYPYGPVYGSIRLITNDPKNPVQFIYEECIVEEPDSISQSSEP